MNQYITVEELLEGGCLITFDQKWRGFCFKFPNGSTYQTSKWDIKEAIAVIESSIINSRLTDLMRKKE